MILQPIIKPTDPDIYGLIECPACDVVHARFSEAVYSFVYMAKATGDRNIWKQELRLLS